LSEQPGIQQASVSAASDDWDASSAQYVATEARQMATLCASVDGAKLCGRASEIRGGVPCTIDLSVKSLSAAMGGHCCHAPAIVDDGVTWFARFRLDKVSSPPVEARDYILRSEAATMVFLRTQTGVPVPKVFDWAAEADLENEVGMGYILMAKMEGKPLDWQQLTGEQKEKVLQGFVDVFLELERHPFDRIRSILSSKTDNTRFEVQGIAHHSTFDMAEAGEQPLGPFDSSVATVRAVVE
jgi:hypothetical protein